MSNSNQQTSPCLKTCHLTRPKACRYFQKNYYCYLYCLSILVLDWIISLQCCRDIPFSLGVTDTCIALSMLFSPRTSLLYWHYVSILNNCLTLVSLFLWYCERYEIHIICIYIIELKEAGTKLLVKLISKTCLCIDAVLRLTCLLLKYTKQCRMIYHERVLRFQQTIALFS